MQAQPELPRLSKSERHRRIVRQLAEAPALRASELAVALGVSNETIRRDLMDLDGQGLLNRTYGGAARPFGTEAPVAARQKEFIPERQAIARAICARIAPGEVVMIGAGATTGHVARHLALNSRDIVVVTHAYTVAMALASNPTIRTLMLPGRYMGREAYVYGARTIAAVEDFEANWAIVGASGIGPRGAYDADDEGGAVYRAMALRASKAFVVADASKVGQQALTLYARWEELDGLVTEVEPPAALARTLQRAGVELVLPGADSAMAEERGEGQ